MSFRSLLASVLLVAACVSQAAAAPSLAPAVLKGRNWRGPFDVQAHRGGRGNTVENTLPSFAWGMIHGANTLELDNGITKDGVVVVFHDQILSVEKCKDTKPAFPGDPDFPYVGKAFANLTLAQVKTVDCGSLRQLDFPLQLTYPGVTISTLQEVFEFVQCADPDRQMKFNIESKVDPTHANMTVGPEEFASKQFEVFRSSGYPLTSITHQSFDWRTSIAIQKLDTSGDIPIAALASSGTVELDDGATWLAGLKLSDFPGDTEGERLANAAASVGTDILSPSAAADNSPVADSTQPGFIFFTNKEMIDAAHGLGLQVIPWTVDDHNIAQQLVDWGVEGIISDFPDDTRRFVHQQGFAVGPTFSEDLVLDCLNRHMTFAQ